MQRIEGPSDKPHRWVIQRSSPAVLITRAGSLNQCGSVSHGGAGNDGSPVSQSRAGIGGEESSLLFGGCAAVGGSPVRWRVGPCDRYGQWSASTVDSDRSGCCNVGGTRHSFEATFCCPDNPATTPSDEAWSKRFVTLEKTLIVSAAGCIEVMLPDSGNTHTNQTIQL